MPKATLTLAMRLLRVALLLTLLCFVALTRVALTWRVYTPTFDEPAHIAAGMEWLSRGGYHYDEAHPPLARVADALGPWLAGLHSQGQADIRREGNAILNQRGDQPRALALARAGALPFLLLAILVVFAWARSLAGDAAGLLAILALTSVPPVLAHAGLATTDAAAMGTVALAIYSMLRWLERPGLRGTLLLGVVLGLALLSSMSALIFLPAALVVVLAAWRSAGNPVAPHVGGALVAGSVALLVVWAGYRFSVGAINQDVAASVAVPAPQAPGRPLEQEVASVLRWPVYPAPEYVRAIHGLGNHRGQWSFFPMALALKTPIPFLLLAIVGAAALTVAARKRRSALVPPLAALAILLAAMAANTTTGVREILPIYPLLAVCAGVGILTLWYRRPRKRLRFAGPALAVALTGWLVAESVRAHPDYLPYFNELAGDHPEQVLQDSDFDWGQDLGRLADTLRTRAVAHVWIAYHGRVDMSRQGLPAFTELPPGQPETGWVAASLFTLAGGEQGEPPDAYAWLRSYQPVARIGHSILLYYIPQQSHQS
ncbi:MAG TPA: glycosyltransferase family 39 protein [Gemmatimonadales bacterium]|nr:glycosyltransferase family 39 protein [Gemmatimonadales bacterium]